MHELPSQGEEQARPPSPHLWPDTARVDTADRLRIGGLDVAELARDRGTPLYLYDEATIRTQCRAFLHAFATRWPESAIAYAGKAYLSPALCRILLDEGLELDAVSSGELGIALRAGCAPGRIHLHGNFKPEHELAKALNAGVGRIVVDSLDELACVEALARERGIRAAIWLRLCPDVAAETHAYTRTGHAGSKFGIELATGEAHEAARRAVASPWLDLVGLHAHAGSQLFDLAPCGRSAAFLIEAAAALREGCGAEIREISPGGGLAVAYLPGDVAPTIEHYAGAVTAALSAACERLRVPRPRLVVEPGRAIVARAGVAVYTVGPRKVTSDGTIFVAVDGGLGDNPRPALYQADYTAALVERMTAPPVERVRVVGRYCETGDALISAVELPRVAPGDLLAIPVSGAYHLPMASNYNGVARPAVCFADEGAARLVRRRETLDDLLRLETP
jgi:diaminopimelate decarboxylase